LDISELKRIIFSIATAEMMQKYEQYLEKLKHTHPQKLPFNIFHVISDVYYRENFHSDILALLLKNPTVFKNFLKLLDMDTTNYEQYKVSREKGRIDILIVSDNGIQPQHCIIIENKLNWANDQPKQLERYYRFCIEQGYTVDNIVYLTPDRSKKPSEDSKGSIEDSKIIIVTGYTGESDDLYSHCFDTDYKDEEDDWRVIIKHYAEILKLTGRTKMTELSGTFYDEIIKDTNLYKQACMVVDIYNELRQVRIQKLIDEFDGANWKNERFYKNIEIGDRTFAIDVIPDTEKTWLQIFCREPDESTEKEIKQWINDLFEGDCSDFEWNYDINRYEIYYEFPAKEELLYQDIRDIIDFMQGKNRE